MTDKVKFTAIKRTNLGKGASRRLRKQNTHIPAIFYGQDIEPQPISIEQREFYRQLEQNDAMFSQILDLDIEGKVYQVIIRDLQRHVYKPTVLHVDFQVINKNEELTIYVPLRFVNEENCVGVKNQGGYLMGLITEVEISALPQDLPEFIEVDVLNLEINATMHMSDLKLPKGVKLVSLAVHDNDLAVVNVVPPVAENDEVVADDAQVANSSKEDGE